MRPRTLALLACLVLAAPASLVHAADEALAVAQGDDVAAILTARTGQVVTVRLGDEEITGTVKTVGDHLVHMERLSGKDFFDAAVRLDRIDAVIVRVRSN
jgi:hypothetical protein